MTDITDIQNTVNWGIGTGVTLGVAGMAMKGMNRMMNVKMRGRRTRKKKK